MLQAQSSGAKVIALANTGTDAINAIKQAHEFGLLRGGRSQIAALFLQISDVQALGLATAQGLLLASPFYWDLTKETRAWSRRWSARMGGRMPTMDQAGVYSATLAWLRAAGAAAPWRASRWWRKCDAHDPGPALWSGHHPCRRPRDPRHARLPGEAAGGEPLSLGLL